MSLTILYRKRRPNCSTAQVNTVGKSVSRRSALLGVLHQNQSALSRGILQIAEAWSRLECHQILHSIWSALPKVSIGQTNAEPAAADGKVAGVEVVRSHGQPSRVSGKPRRKAARCILPGYRYLL